MNYLNDVNYKDCVGKVYKSKSSGYFKIAKYNDSRNVEIQFLKTGFEAVAELGQIKNGEVKDRYAPSVYGVGILGTKYPSKVNGTLTKESELWRGMLKRCYSDVYKKKYPTYEDCEASENFKSYEYFYEWCRKQIGFDNKNWHLDKDLLVKGNKVYSEDSCIFLPSEINLALTKNTASRGEYLIGVCWCNTKKAFVAQVNRCNGRPERLGYFNTELEAFNAYKQAKEIYIKELANNFHHQIDPRAYNALMNYNVEITD